VVLASPDGSADENWKLETTTGLTAEHQKEFSIALVSGRKQHSDAALYSSDEAREVFIARGEQRAAQAGKTERLPINQENIDVERTRTIDAGETETPETANDLANATDFNQSIVLELASVGMEFDGDLSDLSQSVLVFVQQQFNFRALDVELEEIDLRQSLLVHEIFQAQARDVDGGDLIIRPQRTKSVGFGVRREVHLAKAAFRGKRDLACCQSFHRRNFRSHQRHRLERECFGFKPPNDFAREIADIRPCIDDNGIGRKLVSEKRVSPNCDQRT
jgi:hypothetical protein